MNQKRVETSKKDNRIKLKRVETKINTQNEQKVEKTK